MVQVAAAGAVPLATFASSPIVLAIGALYRVADGMNEWIDRHIEDLKSSADPLKASIGRVLEGVKFGFGLSYIGSTCLIAVGQLLLGNTLEAVITVASSAVLMNPIAMTCAAIGAIYFGWAALTEREREQILERLARGLTVGVELLRALIDFAIRRSRELLDSKQLERAKQFIKAQAEAFGRTLYDVTRQLGDFTSEAVGTIAQRAGEAAQAIKETASKVGDVVSAGAGSATETLKIGASKATDTVRAAVDAATVIVKDRRRTPLGPVMMDLTDRTSTEPSTEVGSSQSAGQTTPPKSGT